MNTCPRIPLASPTGLRSKPFDYAQGIASRRSRPDRRGSSGRFGFCFCCGFAGVLFAALSVDIGTHRFQGCPTHTADEVSSVPEQRFCVKITQLPEAWPEKRMDKRSTEDALKQRTELP